MLRAFLVILAVLIAVLAFVFDRYWLYAGALVPLAGALGLLGWQLWQTYRSHQRRDRSRSDSPDQGDSLEEYGIMDIRPQDGSDPQPAGQPKEKGTLGDSSSSVAASEEESSTPASPSPTSTGADAALAAPAEREDETEGETKEVEGGDVSEEAPVLGPFLQSLRAALNAQTVCLLVQEEVLLTYRIQALASIHSDVQRTGSFDTQVPLLTATMSRQPHTVRFLKGDELSVEDLGYYETPPDIDSIAVAPISRPDESASSFLLADATAEADLGSSRARSLLEHYADMASLLLDTDPSAPSDDGEPQPEENAEEEASLSSPVEQKESAEEVDDEPRPRREIIAEEMRAADAASEELALVLVHLNRAESIARRGEDAVASAERLFRARLEQMAVNERVERFGELTYGVFFRGGAEAVEPWASDLQKVMAQETGELEGGVSVGVAVWSPRHDGPEDLRGDATEALWEAYETGACTIVA